MTFRLGIIDFLRCYTTTTARSITRPKLASSASRRFKINPEEEIIVATYIKDDDSSDGQRRRNVPKTPVDIFKAQKVGIALNYPGDPYLLSNKIQRLLQKHPLQDVMEYLSKAPTSLQNPVSWILLIQKAALDKQANLAFSLFNQIKKRGLEPTSSAYVHLFKAFSNVPTSNNLTRAKNLFQHLWQSGRLNLFHLNAFFHVYARSGLSDRLVGLSEQFLDMSSTNDGEGGKRLKPSKFTISILVKAFTKRTEMVNKAWDWLCYAREKQLLDAELLCAAYTLFRLHYPTGQVPAAWIFDIFSMTREWMTYPPAADRPKWFEEALSTAAFRTALHASMLLTEAKLPCLEMYNDAITMALMEGKGNAAILDGKKTWSDYTMLAADLSWIQMV